MSGENCAGSFHIEIAAMRAANLVCEPERAQIASFGLIVNIFPIHPPYPSYANLDF
jgi:hypothetical protein